MTVEELMQELAKCSPDAIVMYRHNKYGRVDIDTIEYKQEEIASGNYIYTVTLEGIYEED